MGKLQGVNFCNVKRISIFTISKIIVYFGNIDALKTGAEKVNLKQEYLAKKFTIIIANPCFYTNLELVLNLKKYQHKEFF